MTITRRGMLKTGTALGMAGMLPAAAFAQGKPPVARLTPVTETLWGVAVTDNYRWMEKADSPELLQYLKDQDAYARARLAALPERDALLARITRLSGEAVATGKVQAAGDRMFYEQRPAGANNFKLFVKTGSGPARLLFDPEVEKGPGGKFVSVSWWEASPDGSHLAVGVSEAGSEQAIARVIRVADGVTMPARIGKVDFGLTGWLPDGRGFFYTQLAGDYGTINVYKNSMAKLHRLGDDPAKDRLIVQRGRPGAPTMTEDEGPAIITAPGSAAALLIVIDGVRNEIRVHTAPLADAIAGTAKWAEVTTPADKVTRAKLLGDRLYLLENRSSDMGRVVSVDALRPVYAQAREAMPAAALVAEDITAARDGIYVTVMDGGVQRLRRIGLDGRVSDVALPFEGTVGGVYASPDADGAYLALVGWVNPLGIYRADAAGVRDTGLNPPPPIDVSAYESFRVMATARDGTRVPVSVVKRRDTKRDGTAPALVDAYGSYQIPSTAYFSPRMLAFLDRGGVWATAHVRGGGEYGRPWHAAGRLLNKPNTWRDMIDCCQALIDAKIAAPRGVAIRGGSAGGITVGRALTERPDLFAAVIGNVGVHNNLRVEFSPNGPGNIPEFGSVTTEDGFKGLLAMDSVRAVKPGTRYPWVMLTTGATDPRVTPWQIAKFAAALQAANAGPNPVIMRVDFDAGHGVGSTRDQRDKEMADTYAFVLAAARPRATGA